MGVLNHIVPIVALLLGLHQQSNAIEVLWTSQALAQAGCAPLLTRAPLVLKDSTEAAVGLFEQVPYLLRKVGIDGTTAEFLGRELYRYLQVKIALPLPYNPSLYLKNLDQHRSKILFCSGMRRCTIDNDEIDDDPLFILRGGDSDLVQWAAMRTGVDRYRIGDVENLAVITVESARRQLPRYIGLRRYDVIFFRAHRPRLTGDGTVLYEDKTQHAVWISSFIGEMSRVITMNYLDQWVRANLRLLARNQSADDLFTAWVRLAPNDMLVLDTNFVTALLHSVAGKVRSSVEAEVLSLPTIDSDRQQKVVTYRTLLNKIDEEKLRRFGVTAFGVFQFGLNVVSTMEKTIAAASSLPAE